MQQDIQVILNSRHAPIAFEWQGRMQRVREVQECWRLIGAWWDGDGERTFFRVLTEHGGIYELYFDHVDSAWRLSAIRD
ncbi:MAG: hypothetical protein GX139_05930 [Armatimonadetes bacterium]|jgi:hypothetical protein|nr:hypothetical protein [Armatimonadota bacterium]